MTPVLAKIFSNFFKERSKLDSLTAQKGILPGWIEQARIEAFDQLPEENIELQWGVLWKLLTGKVYKIYYFELTCILVVYSDKTILWLDYHVSNTDYEIFMARENLLSWYPERKDKLIRLLVETKLNYLGRPQVIHSVEDIPHKENSNPISQKRLAEVTQKIFSPIYTQNLDGSLRLQFYLWTHILGKIFAVDCTLGPGSAFSYSGEVLTREVGDYFLPR